MIYDALIAPFTEFEFMRRALAAVIALSLGGAPIGVFLMLRRMSLVGDAMAHAILPGAAIGFLLSGLNLFAMTTGGLIAGFAVAILAGVVARTTELKEDASLATFYLVSLALGVTIVSIKGTNIDLLHVLFGNILAMDDQTLLVIAFNATITLLVLAVIYRPLVIECVDPVFLRTVSRAGAPAHLAFLALVVDQSRQRLSCARHLAGGRADDPARGHRAVLVARHHRHDLHRGRERDACRAMPGWCCRSRPGFPRALRSSWWRRRSMSSRCCSATSAAWSGRCFPAAISRRSGSDAASSLWLDLSGARGRRLPARAQDRLKVVASFSILGDFVRNVGGDRVNVTTLVGPDGDVHVYAPTPADAKKIADAKLVIVNGLGLEGWLPRLVQSSGSKAAIVTATNGIAPLKLGSDADPHAWQSVANAKIYVANIRDALVAADPAGRRGLSRQCRRLSGETRCAGPRGAGGGRRKFRRTRRKVISTHDAFGYFAAAYGIEFIAPLGVSTESEPSARDIAGIITQIKTRKNSGGFSRKYQRSAADPADIGRDRRQGRRDAVFGQFDRRKGRCPHLH